MSIRVPLVQPPPQSIQATALPREPTTKIVAIHQPNFFPWLGYFDKIRRADVFVFLDDVQYTKQSWINRVRLNIQGEARWITCPVRRNTMAGSIRFAEIDDTKDWRTRLQKTLEANYGRATHFASTMELLGPLIEARDTSLGEFNMRAVKTITDTLGIETELRRQSEISVSGASNELLVSLVTACGGDAYLIGGGADGYHDQQAFDAAGLRVIPQAYTPSTYGPPDRYIPGLSVIDYLMHEGFKRTLASGMPE